MKQTKHRLVRTAVLCVIGSIWSGTAMAAVTTTVIGTTGDGPIALVLDSAGNIYTANSGSDNVTKITPGGVSSLFSVAGDQPSGIVIDSAGNLFVSSSNDDTVTKIDSNGTILATYPTGSGPNRIAIDSLGNVYTANGNSLPGTVTKIDTSGTVSTYTLAAGSFGPRAIATDSAGNVYVANFNSNNVTKMTSGGVSSIFGSTGTGPHAIAIDSLGNVYTANYGSNNVTKITPGGISTILGITGSSPVGIAVDSQGNVFTTNTVGNSVTKISPDGSSSIYGSAGSWPVGILIAPNGDILVTNSQGTDTVSKLARVSPAVNAVPIAVTFDSQGGSPIAKGTTINGGSVTDPGSPTRGGYTFLGWNTAANGTGTAITFPYHHTNSSEFTLYAQWRAIVSSTPMTTPPTTVLMPLIPEELPSTGGEFAMWPLLFIAAGFALITLRRYDTTR